VNPVNVITAATTLAETIVLTVSPSGGQGTARQNALSAAEAAAVTARERAEAAAALTAVGTPEPQPAAV
jgi:hypothetical protein